MSSFDMPEVISRETAGAGAKAGSGKGKRLSDYDYDLPQELIAAVPAARRTGSRLMKINREDGRFSHHRFSGILEILNYGDVLVLNNTKVIPARLLGMRQAGGKAEVLLLKEISSGSWEALLKPSSRISQGDLLAFESGKDRLEARVLDCPRKGSGMRLLFFQGPGVRAKIQRIGRMPLPPYIQREDTPEDQHRYQTVFAEREGAVAAPTAGLHFDKPLLEALRKKGVEIVYLTLHTGYGTFQPVHAEDITRHQMFAEEFEISGETAAAVNKAKEEGRRIIACGTTSARALESSVDASGRLLSGTGSTGLFIYPPFRFRMTDGLITNFHLPKSTLLMLVSAFLGYDYLTRAYREAVREKYRFYSYGDAMIIL